MKSAQGTTLDGVALRQGLTAVTSGTFENANMIECVIVGTVQITWHDGTTQDVAFAAGRTNPFDGKSVQVLTGTFNIGKE